MSASAAVGEWEEERDRHSLRASTGILAMVPLLLLYELCLAADGHAGPRSAAEYVAGRALAPLGGFEAAARVGLVIVVGLFALWNCRRREVPFLARALRQVAEGLAAAVLLGPLLVGLVSLTDVSIEALRLPEVARTPSTGFVSVLRHASGAAWEELLFRLAGYGAIFLLARRLLGFFGAGRPVAHGTAELLALLLSSLAFAAFHLEIVRRVVAPGGEGFDGGIFLWRLLAGILLALLFRVRGIGTAAWAHAFFDFGLSLGVAPPA
jgi:hypothetical protein